MEFLIKFEEYRRFCENNHIAGSVNSSIRIGLEYNGKLIQVIGVGKSRFKQGEYELLRQCSKLGITVVGGFSKLIKYVGRKYSIPKLVTYCDRRLFTGRGYIQSGWRIIGETNPNYWYFSESEHFLHSRMRFQKHKLAMILPEFSPESSEFENMKINGWMRYYDCGSLKSEYIGENDGKV